jgi:hypothetical protein
MPVWRASLAAQTSSLQGLITDAQSARPEAVVTATNQSTSAVRKTLSGATGGYSFVQLPPGAYKIAVEKPGFRSYTAELRLQIDTPASLNIQMELGQVTESVSVEAEALAINTQNASVGNPSPKIKSKVSLCRRAMSSRFSAFSRASPDGQVSAQRPTKQRYADGVDVNDNRNPASTPSCWCR